MDRRRLILLAVLAIAGLMLFRGLLSGNKEVPVEVVSLPETKYVNVLVSTADISMGERLAAMHLSWKEWPEEVASPQFITRESEPQAMDEMIGRLVRSDIFEKEPIIRRKLVDVNGGLMTSLLREGMRAVTTQISADTAAGGFIQPGDHVDIILTKEVEQSFNSSNIFDQYQSTTIFENIRVLAIDQILSADSDAGPAVLGSMATFEMTPSDAEILQLSATEGELSLTLRPVGQISVAGQSVAKFKAEEKPETEPASIKIYRANQQTIIATKGQ